MRYLLIGLLFCFTFQANAKVCNFQCTLDKHLSAIEHQDFKAFEETITQKDQINFILPDGTFISSTKKYKELIKGWFEQTGWHFKYKIVNQSVSENMAHVLLLIHYREDEREGKPYEIDHYLSLIFEKQNNNWRLTHDQNTKTQLEK